MPSQRDTKPQREEIKRQLAKMLADPEFASRPKQAELLACIVRGALAGREITEKYIRGKVFPFPPYKPGSTIARRTIDLVRKRLKRYYADAGKDDLIVIMLPQSPPGRRIKFQAGHAYRPFFIYNPRHPESQRFRLGIHFLEQSSPAAISEALRHLHEVTFSRAEHAGAHIGLAEALCAMSAYMGRSSPEENLLSVAWEIANDAVALSPDDWRTHAVRGAVLLCCDEVAKAKPEFAKALRLDRAQAQRYFWYHAYLFTAGRRKQAMELARLHAAENIESAHAQTAYGFYLYISRRLEESEAALKAALKLDRNWWLTHAALCVLYLSLSRPDEALHHYERIQLLIGDEKGQWVMPGLAALCACRSREIPSKKRRGMVRWSKELIARIDESVDWFQAALACMAFGETPQAIRALRCAYNQRHSLMLWLDAWPILDPLRMHRGFKSLLTRQHRDSGNTPRV